MKSSTLRRLSLLGVLLLAAASRASVLPQIQEALKGAGKTSPLKVLRFNSPEPRARGLVEAFKGRIPAAGLPAEGYLLETGPQGATLIASDAAGLAWGQQTLEALGAKGSGAVRIADWPDFTLRGFHLIPYTPAALPGMKRLVRDYLVPLRCNFFVFEIDYAFDYKSHPEVREKVVFTRDQIRDFADYCRGYGIRIIPEINCLGHQSWTHENVHGLLRSHPEFEEIPDGKIPQTDPAGKRFYCRSWCPLHPGVNKVVFDLMDELVEAFGADGFHAGMDEVFVLGSADCPRCKGKKPGDLYAKAVNDIHAHLASKGLSMFMWGDRLLNAKEMSDSEWQASADGSDQAISRIPKDIIVADWHYDYRPNYPSLDALRKAGLRVMPTTYSSASGTAQFLAKAWERHDPAILGPMTSVWFSALEAAASAFPEDASLRGVDPETGDLLPKDKWAPVNEGGLKVMAAAALGLKGGWNHADANPESLFPPYKAKAAQSLPGLIQAEDFDEGGEGQGYHDADAYNEGGEYRAGGVDISAVRKEKNAYSVGWVEDGEWTAYAVKVAKAGTYEALFRIACQGPGGSIRLELNGKGLGPALVVPDSGGWSKWEELKVSGLKLDKGPGRLRVIADKGPYNLDSVSFRIP